MSLKVLNNGRPVQITATTDATAQTLFTSVVEETTADYVTLEVSNVSADEKVFNLGVGDVTDVANLYSGGWVIPANTASPVLIDIAVNNTSVVKAWATDAVSLNITARAVTRPVTSLT